MSDAAARLAHRHASQVPVHDIPDMAIALAAPGGAASAPAMTSVTNPARDASPAQAILAALHRGFDTDTKIKIG